jgi:CarboxypepD_reg-like domain
MMAEKRLVRCMVLLLMILSPQFSQAQEAPYISGKVTDEATGKPVAGCSVYFSNTSKGAITTATGEFLIKNLPAGKYEMVISAIGYETEVIPVSSNNYPHTLQVKLRNHSTELSEIVIQPSLKNGWEKWGQTFLDNFIGNTSNAVHCRLKNREAIKFWFSEKNNRLTARAEETLIIENEALGYIIKFKLEEFVLDFNLQLFVYNGYPLFQEMTDNKKESKWKENRKNAYYGSVLEFMRCIYNDRLLEAGYQVIAYKKWPNTEKLRVKQIADPTTRTQSKDSASYYKNVLKQPDTLLKYVALTTLDSMIITNDDNSKSFFFLNKLAILYKRYPQSKAIQSEIYLITPAAIQVQENGSYFSTKELITGMHWAQYEKMANLLPFDYFP